MNNYPLILIAKGSNTRIFLDDFCEKNNIMLSPEMELASHSLVTAFTKIGLGIGYATNEFLKKDLKEQTIFEIKTTPTIPPRQIGATYLKQKQLNKASLTFLNLLKEIEEE